MYEILASLILVLSFKLSLKLLHLHSKDYCKLLLAGWTEEHADEGDARSLSFLLEAPGLLVVCCL